MSPGRKGQVYNMEISGKTDVLGLIGNPVEQTLSPLIHNAISEEMGIDAVYVPFPVAGDAVTAVRGAFKLGIRGMNVTVPYKTEVIPALAGIDPAAEAIGAVNTLVRTEEGFAGYNTDMPGLGRALEKNGVVLKDRQVVILGAGGASRAAVSLAASKGADGIYILNRTKEKAEKLVGELGAIFPESRIIPLSAEEYEKVPRRPSVFFQCTSLGLRKGDGLLVEDRSFYSMAEYGYDLVYRPAKTPFLSVLAEMGIPGDNGLSMLLYQGIIAYEHWFSVNVPEETVQRVRNLLERKVYGENILLTGYMGCGKTTIGRKMAEAYHMEFLDTDQLIEERAGMRISEIFRTKGEPAFRDMETELLGELSRTRVRTVIATGGGIVLRPENRRLLRKTGKVVLLQASPETIRKRTSGDDSRPLLSGTSGEDEGLTRIRKMLKEREAAYLASAEHFLDTEKETPEMLVRKLAEMTGYETK